MTPCPNKPLTNLSPIFPEAEKRLPCSAEGLIASYPLIGIFSSTQLHFKNNSSVQDFLSFTMTYQFVCTSQLQFPISKCTEPPLLVFAWLWDSYQPASEPWCYSEQPWHHNVSLLSPYTAGDYSEQFEHECNQEVQHQELSTARFANIYGTAINYLPTFCFSVTLSLSKTFLTLLILTANRLLIVCETGAKFFSLHHFFFVKRADGSARRA